MATYYGNQVAYGSGSWFRVVLDVSHSGATTGSSVNVTYTYKVQFLYSINDSVNTGRGSSVFASANFDNTSYVFGSGGGTKVVGGPVTHAKGIVYGSTTNIRFTLSVSGLAGVSGTSSLDINFSLPARLPALPGAPVVAVQDIRATHAHTYIATAPTSNGGAILETSYRLHVNIGGAIFGEKSGPYSGVGWDGLTRSTGYVIFARCRNSSGWGPFSAGVGFNTDAAGPDAPLIPSSSSITQTGFTITWAMPADVGGSAVAGFQLQVDDDPAFGTPFHDDTYAPDELSQAITGRTANTNYYARVRCWNTNGYSGWSPTRTVLTSATVPTAPGKPTSSNITATTALLQWPAATARGSAITGYQVEVATDLGFTTPDFTGTPTGLSVTATGLTSGVLYNVRVRANSALGYGAWSSIGTIKAVGGLFVNVGGEECPAELWHRIGYVWHLVELFTNDAGEWKQITFKKVWISLPGVPDPNYILVPPDPPYPAIYEPAY